MDDLRLWYRQPARQWVEALPLGNGRLGAMHFAGIATERLQLNEDTLWAGGPYDPANPQALAHLNAVRGLIFAGRYAEAESLADAHLMARPLKQMPYQPAGDLWLDFAHGEARNYRRELDLDTAIATVRYEAGDVTYTRELFISPVAGVLVMQLSASAKGAVNCTIRLDSPQSGATSLEGGDTLCFDGHNRAAEGIAGQLRFAMRATVHPTGGTLRGEGDRLVLTGADEAVILLDVATSFVRFDQTDADPLARIAARLAPARGRSFAALRDEHVAAHQALFRRLSLNLGTSDAAALPTDERIARNAPTADPALAALYVQYGRYLILASSRPGTQPANLQGIWNDLLDPPWGSKYTANINLQMNYWLPDPANLGECVEPLVRMVEDLAITGAKMAQDHYAARGWVMHHNTDLWRATGPIDGAKWGLWPTGGAWLCVQLGDHLAFEWNDALARRLLPVMAGAVRFILDVLVPHPATGELVTVPSLSPENVHPFGAAICAGPTMDTAIIRDLFATITEIATRLGAPVPFADEIEAATAKLPRPTIGKAGQLQEWLEDWDLDVPEIHHRHVSHLYGLYPSQQIGLRTTPALAAGARKSLEIRGDDATGWGIGWRINLWARLGDGNHAHDVVSLLLGPERTYPNMFDAHPPFQIDGNFGGAAGILEMLVQSGRGEIDLLPALPDAWPTGQVSGVKARGSVVVDLQWRSGSLEAVTLQSPVAQSIIVRCGPQSRGVDFVAGVALRLAGPDLQPA